MPELFSGEECCQYWKRLDMIATGSLSSLEVNGPAMLPARAQALGTSCSLHLWEACPQGQPTSFKLHDSLTL